MQSPSKFLHKDSLAMYHSGRRQKFVHHLCSKAALNPRETLKFLVVRALFSEAPGDSIKTFFLPRSPCFSWNRRSLQNLMWFENVSPFHQNFLVGRCISFTSQFYPQAKFRSTYGKSFHRKKLGRVSQPKDSCCCSESKHWDLHVDAQISEAWSGPRTW